MAAILGSHTCAHLEVNRRYKDVGKGHIDRANGIYVHNLLLLAGSYYWQEKMMGVLRLQRPHR